MTLPISFVFSLPFISALSFAIPFFLGGPQLLVGTIVNACLFGSFLKSQKVFFSIALFPSLAVLSRGLVFGHATKYLYFFVPVIWFANFVLIYTFGKTNFLGKFSSVIIASSAKSAILFLFAQVLVSAHIVPKLFLTTMGINQFLSAVLGGFIAICLLPNNKK